MIVSTPKICGICERGPDPDETIWPNLHGRYAHTLCYRRKVEKSEKYFLDTLTGLLSKYEDYRELLEKIHKVAMEALQTACGSETVSSYFDNHGEEALTALFKDVALPAAKGHMIILKIEKLKEQAQKLEEKGMRLATLNRKEYGFTELEKAKTIANFNQQMEQFKSSCERVRKEAEEWGVPFDLSEQNLITYPRQEDRESP